MSNQYKWKVIATAAVDSGQLMVVDPCYIREGLDYDAVCEKTLKGDRSGEHIAAGVGGTSAVFASGFGDGSYPVVAKFEDCGDCGIRITEVRVLMGDDTVEALRELVGDQ